MSHILRDVSHDDTARSNDASTMQSYSESNCTSKTVLPFLNKEPPGLWSNIHTLRMRQETSLSADDLIDRWIEMDGHLIA
jgi:hypothetical protein